MKKIGKFAVVSENFIEHNNEFWFVATRKNWLCKMSKTELVAEKLCEIPYGKFNSYDYEIAYGEEDCILLMPIFADYILKYYIESNTFERYLIKSVGESSYGDSGRDVKFRSSVKTDTAVWIMPQSAKCIIEWNYKTDKITEHTEWFNVFNKYGWSEGPFFGKGIFVNNSLWLPCVKANAVVEFDTITKKERLHNVGDKDNIFIAITYCNNRLWLMDNHKTEVLGWDFKTDETIKISQFPQDYGVDQMFRDMNGAKVYDIYCMYTLNEKEVLLLPLYANQFLIVDTDLKKIRKKFNKPVGESYISAVRLDENQVVCLSQKSNKLIIYHEDLDEITIKEFDTKANVGDEVICINEKEMKFMNFLEYICADEEEKSSKIKKIFMN